VNLVGSRIGPNLRASLFSLIARFRLYQEAEAASGEEKSSV